MPQTALCHASTGEIRYQVRQGTALHSSVVSKSLPTPPPGTSYGEKDRIHALRRYDFLREEHHDAFDRIARIAAHALQADGAGVSLVDEDQIRFVGRHGIPVQVIARRQDAFCNHVVGASGPVVVDDAADDGRFRNNPLVCDAGTFPGGPIRFYAGAPIVVDGQPVGAAFVFDHAPRSGLCDRQREALADLADAAARELIHGVAHRRLSDVFDHAVDAIFTISHDGVLVSLNPAFERITGHACSEWLGRSFEPLLHPDDRDLALESFARTLAGEEVSVELRVLGPEGDERPLEVFAVPRTSGGSVIQVFGFARDMRERKAAEARQREQAELLVEREQRLARLARASTDAMWDMDPDTERIWWSEGFETLFGYPLDAYSSADQWEERIHPDDHDRVLAEHRAAIDAHAPTWQDEYRYRRADGTYAHVMDRAHLEYDENGALHRIYGGMVDITDRKEAELALRRSEELFRNLYANAPIGIYRTTPDGRVLMANDALVRMLGFESFEELAHRDLDAEGYPTEQPRDEFRERVENQSAVEGFETVWLKRDGTPVDVREHARAVRDEDGTVLYYEGTVENVTEQRRFEDALRRLVELPAATGDRVFGQLVEAVSAALGTRWSVLVRPAADGRMEIVAADGADLPVLMESCQSVVTAVHGSAVEILAGLRFHCERDCGFLSHVPATALLGTPVYNTQGDLVGALLALHDEPLPKPSASDRWLLTAFAQRAGAELEERDHIHRLEASARAADVLRSAEGVQEVYQRATTEVLVATAARSVSVTVYDPAREQLVVEFAAGPTAASVQGRTLARGEGIIWRVFDGGKPQFVPDLSAEKDVVFLSDEVGPGAWAGAPLVDQHGRVFGVLTADTVGGPVFRNLSRPDLHYLEAMAQAIGVSVARLRALDQARTQGERFRSLADLSARLELIDDPIDIARTALEALLPLSGFGLGTMWTLDGTRLHRVLSVGPVAERVEEVSVDRDLNDQAGVLADVFRRRATIWVPEYRSHPAALKQYADAGLRALVATPLMQDGRASGALVLGTVEEEMHLSDETRSLLQAVAHRVERALQRASARNELVATREEALRAMGLALEYRDYETKGHTDRVTRMALELGGALGLDEQQLRDLRWGAYLHDTGKVSIPDHILLKPGKLDPAEWRRMQEHVTIGETMLRELGFIPDEVLRLVRNHHERWDGEGYPDRLVGPDIPLLARIFAVVDVYDALTSERPYKDAWLPNEALGELEGQAGRQFDPEIVGTFLRFVSTRNMRT